MRAISALFFKAECTTRRFARWSFWAWPTRSANTSVPLYVLNVTYPLIDDEVKRFCASKRGVLVIEEGQPDFIEQNLHSILRRADIATKVHGKDLLAMAGEYTAAVVTKGILKFVEQYAPELIDRERLPSVVRPKTLPPISAGSSCAAAVVLHRVPGAADFYRDEAGGARTGAAPRELRYRLPSCSRFCRRSTSARPPWATASVGRARRHSRPRNPASAPSASWATADSGITG